MRLSVGYAGGTWDLLHVGHLDFLEACRERCDVLIVGVVDDASIPRWKGGRKPIIPYADRVRLLEALRCVDKVVEHKLVNKVVGEDAAALGRQPDPEAPYGSLPFCPYLEGYVKQFGVTTFFHGSDHVPQEYKFLDVPLRIIPYSSLETTTAILERIRAQ